MNTKKYPWLISVVCLLVFLNSCKDTKVAEKGLIDVSDVPIGTAINFSILNNNNSLQKLALGIFKSILEQKSTAYDTF